MKTFADELSRGVDPFGLLVVSIFDIVTASTIIECEYIRRSSTLSRLTPSTSKAVEFDSTFKTDNNRALSIQQPECIYKLEMSWTSPQQTSNG